MKRHKTFFLICFLWLPVSLFSQLDYYQLEVEVSSAVKNSDDFVRLQTCKALFKPEDFFVTKELLLDDEIFLPNSVGRIRLTVSVKHSSKELEIVSLFINEIESIDKKTITISDPVRFRSEPINSNLNINVKVSEPPFQIRNQFIIPIMWERSEGEGRVDTDQYDQSSGLPFPGTAEIQSIKQGGASNLNQYQPVAKLIPPGWAIQFSVQANQPNLEMLKTLADYDMVYYKKEKSGYKIRIGTFGTKEESIKRKAVLQQTQTKAFDFKNAFILYDEGGYTRGAFNPNSPYSVSQEYGNRPAANTDAETPQEYSMTKRVRTPKFPEWYYKNSKTAENAAVSADPKPASYDAINNKSLSGSYAAPGGLTAKGEAPPSYYVQAGAFGNYTNAQLFHQNLLSKGITNAQVIEATKADGTVLYKTWIGPYRTPAIANGQKALMAEKLKILGTTVSGPGDINQNTAAEPLTNNYFTPSRPNTSRVCIQLSAYSNQPNLAEYGHLKKYGSLYVTPDDPLFKLMIGPFADEQEAAKVMPQLRKAGFSSAFMKPY